MTIDMLIVKEFSMAQTRRALEVYYDQTDRGEAWRLAAEKIVRLVKA